MGEVFLVREGEFVYERRVEKRRRRGRGKEEEQVLVSKLVRGEVFGYNEVLERRDGRMYSIKCCTLTGELYVFSLDYWNFLYEIFRREFNNLHQKCVDFRK